MKKLAVLCLFAVLCVTARAQERDDKKPESEKDRLKLPAEIVINASPAKVKSLFLTEYARHSWQLDNETASSLTFTKRGGIGASMAYGKLSKLQDLVTITETEPGKTLVLLDSGVQAPRAAGATERFNINSDKKNRKLNEDLLQRIKTAAEKPGV